MRKRTAEQIEERLNQGYGTGEVAAYKPWLGSGDVPSIGSTTELPGRKTGRHHVVFSNIERDTLLTAQWLDEVIDLREQFPLWPLAETMAIADELKVNHPAAPDGTPFLVTTDLVLTMRDSTQPLQPIAVKPARQLEEVRTLEKLEIEMLYWERRGCKWQIVTDLALPESLIQNLHWIDEYYDITPESLDPDEVGFLVTCLFDELAKGAPVPLRRVCRATDDRLGYEPGTALTIVRHALARKFWQVPLHERLDPARPFPLPRPAQFVATGTAPVDAAR
jgi:hypothetical protein